MLVLASSVAAMSNCSWLQCKMDRGPFLPSNRRVTIGPAAFKMAVLMTVISGCLVWLRDLPFFLRLVCTLEQKIICQID